MTQDQKIEMLCNALKVYADPENWLYNGDRGARVWQEPNTDSPEEIDGFDLATKTLAAVHAMRIPSFELEPDLEAGKIQTPEFDALLEEWRLCAGRPGQKSAKDALVSHITMWGRKNRLEGRRDAHETNVSLVNENCKLTDKLAALTGSLASGEIVAWMSEDGRTCTDRTKQSSMHTGTAESFSIPLYIRAATPPFSGNSAQRLGLQADSLSVWDLIEDYARKLHSVDYWSGSIKNSDTLLPAYKSKDNLRAALVSLASQPAEPILWIDSLANPQWTTIIGEFDVDTKMLTVTGSTKQFGSFKTPLFASISPLFNIPKDWMLVPKVPTTEMKKAGADASGQGCDFAHHTWVAMVSVAPDPKLNLINLENHN